MSLTQRAKQGFLRLPVVKKAILLASAALMISAVLPWYDNRNSFGVGETYLGIQGPLFLVGALVLVFGAISFFNMALPLLGRNFFKLNRKSGVTAVILGLQSLFLLVVANSVFFHPSFGTNISHKGTRFGMLIAFASIGVMVIAGWMTHRKEKAGKFDEMEIDDFMTNPTAAAKPVARPVASVAPAAPVTATPTTPSYQRPSAGPASNSRAGQYGAGSGVDPLTLDPKERYKMMKSQARYSQTAQKNLWGSGRGSAFSGSDTPKAQAVEGHEVSDSMKIRMDL
jgi:hypothetical protein